MLVLIISPAVRDTLVACAYIRERTYSCNVQAVRRNTSIRLEQGPHGIVCCDDDVSIVRARK